METAFDRKFLTRGLRGTVNDLRAILRCYRGGFEFKKEGSQQRKAAQKCVLFLKGIVLTLPAMAAAMPNLAPGSICVIACTVRLERVKLSCLYSKVKILGTLLCVVSAFTMSIMQSTTSAPATEIQYQAHSPDVIFDKQKIISCLYLLAAVFVLFSNVVVQATEIVDRYEADCIPASSRSVKVIYIQTSGNKTCNRTLMESMVNIDLPMT